MLRVNCASAGTITRTGSQANRLEGEAGDDRLTGEEGDDRLFGGSGADHFIFTDSGSGWGNDIVADFEDGSDKLDFRRLGFTPDTLTFTLDPLGRAKITTALGSVTLANIQGLGSIGLEDCLLA